MDKNLILQNLQLIASRSPFAQSEALAAMKAVRVNSPMVQQRYERTVGLALADHAAKWTDDERQQLGAVFIEDDAGGKMRSIRLSDADWDRAKQIGEGNATDGIRAALREYGH